MSSSMIPSLNPVEHLDRASKTNTQIHKKVPTCKHKHLFLMAEARVGHTSALRLEAMLPTTSLHNRRDFSLYTIIGGETSCLNAGKPGAISFSCHKIQDC